MVMGRWFWGAHAARVRARAARPREVFLRIGAFLRLDSSQSSFRRAAAATDAKRRPGFQTSTRAACAPRIAAEPPVDV